MGSALDVLEAVLGGVTTGCFNWLWGCACTLAAVIAWEGLGYDIQVFHGCFREVEAIYVLSNLNYLAGLMAT